MMDAKRRTEIEALLGNHPNNDPHLDAIRELLAALDDAEWRIHELEAKHLAYQNAHKEDQAEIERLRAELTRAHWTGD